MITKICNSIPLKRISINNTQVSFKGYKTTYEDIDISKKKVNSQISSMSGDIDISDSIVEGKISNMAGEIDICDSRINGKTSNKTGNIYVSASNINGDIENISGKITLDESSAIRGNISNTSGSVIIYNSSILGDVSNTNGKISLKDAVVDGTIISKPENLKLKGNNKIKELVLRGFKKAVDADVNKVKAQLAKQGIFIGNIGHINNTEGTIVNVFNDNKLVSTKIVSTNKPFEFKLPKGNIIDIIRFDADKKGVLIIEKGTEFIGKVINGVIKRI